MTKFYLLFVLLIISARFVNAADYAPADTLIIYNDEFMDRLLDYDFAVENITGTYHTKRILDISPNIHDHSYIDTIFQYYNVADTAEVYSSGSGNEFLLKLIVETPKAPIDSNIFVGVSKQVLSRKLGITIDKNVVYIANTEQGFVFILAFKDDKLARYVYYPTYVD